MAVISVTSSENITLSGFWLRNLAAERILYRKLKCNIFLTYSVFLSHTTASVVLEPPIISLQSIVTVETCLASDDHTHVARRHRRSQS